jgi:hypothetical protein
MEWWYISHSTAAFIATKAIRLRHKHLETKCLHLVCTTLKY